MLLEDQRAVVIEELAKAKTGFGLGDVAGREAHRRSPVCGDEVRVRVLIDGNSIVRVTWEGHGCLVSTAATVALAETAAGMALTDFPGFAARYLATLEADAEADADLGDLEAFAGIGRYPLRAGCASLAWRAALEALA